MSQTTSCRHLGNDKTAAADAVRIESRFSRKHILKLGATAVLLLMLPGFAFANQVFERGISPELACRKGISDEIIVKIRLGEYSIDASGKIQLAEKWEKYRLEQGGETLLAFDFAIDNTSDYIAEISQSKTGNANDHIGLSQPYIYRDIRGVTLIVSPLGKENDPSDALNELVIRISKTGKPGVNSKTAQQSKLNPYFIDNYRQHFVNFDCRYEDIGETGSMAIICYDSFLNLMLPYVDWKRQKGIPTTLIPVSQIGASYEQIMSFIQNLYDTDPTLTFVQLVGDYAQMPSIIYGEDNTYGVRDAHYSLLEGDDYYPDIFVGRFSAETVAELETQISRSLEYEKAMHAGSWMAKAVGACAVNPPQPGDDGEHNWEHLDVIRPKLLDFTFTDMDRVYANEGASTQDLAASLNTGKSLFVYTGEGYETYWITPEFHNEDVNALTNDNMLPFVHVVSCLTGQFIHPVCLAEAFMRAQNPVTHEPTGAIGIYAAAPHQGIAPPMRSQDHFVDLLVNGTKNTMGGLCYNGSCNMTDVYGIYGGEYNFLGWNLFGDASLQLRTKLPETLQVSVSSTVPSGTTALAVQASKPDLAVCLSKNNQIIASGFTDSNGAVNLNWTAPTATGETYKLTCTGFNCYPLEREILCFMPGEPFLALVFPTFTDNGDGIINSNESITLGINVSNPSQVNAENAWVEIVCADTLLTLTIGTVQLGTVPAGEIVAAQLGFRVSKHCPDYRIIALELRAHCGSGVWSIPVSIIVHSPVLQIVSAKVLPETNWLNRGDDAIMQYEIQNTGSSKLLSTSFNLASDQPWIRILQPEKTVSQILPDETQTVSFPFHIETEAGSDNLFSLDMVSESANAPSVVHTENHLVIENRAMMESFERELNEVFLWQFTSGAAWLRTESAVDGKYSLKTPALAQNQSASAEISFHLGPTAPYYFHALVFYLKTEGTAENHLRFYVNGVEKQSWSNVSGWQKVWFVLEEGATTVKWTYEQTGNPSSGEDFALLDAIQFPAGTIFSDAVLETETEAINITVHPDQIIYTPVLLKSKDGRYIYYDTILQRDRGNKPKSDDAWLTFNRETFTPGKRNNYLVTLYNTYQNQVVTEAIISLQQTRALALSATNLSMSGEQSLTCTTFFPSNNLIYWSDDTGTTADSLRCVLALTTELDITTLPMLYHITLKDAEGFITNRLGSITLSADGASGDFLYIDPDLGSIFEQEVERLTLSCFEPTLPEDLSGYRLVIYYNGMNYLSLPINITYDPTPGIDTGKISLKAYPNPFSDYLKIDYYLPGWDRADLTAYNIKGQKVMDFQYQQPYPGSNIIMWDGKDSQGKRLASGVYIIRLRTGESGEKTARCLLLN